MLVRADIIEAGRAVALDWADGRRARFHAVWLRDNAQDAVTRSPGNGQRLIALRDIAEDVRVVVAEAQGEALAVRFAPDHATRFRADWLAARSYDRAMPHAHGWTGPEVTRWDAGTLPQLPTAAFPALRDGGAALREWLAALRPLGVAHVSGLPTEPGSLTALVALFGFVRETNYGRVFDVRVEADASNLAYTNLGLDPHTDNPYRDPVPTIQVLACLENSVAGGESVVVDGFAVASRLAARAFELLARYPMRFEYAGARGVRLRAKRPVLECGPNGELLAVRWNNRSAAAPVDVPYDDLPAYYAALRQFEALATDAAMAVRFRLAPGEAFVVDNTRVLHARTAFTGAGRRWLQGCYADRDGMLSTLAALEEEAGG